MFGSAVLDIGIGLVFIYLLLSLMCSAVNEIIEARLKSRAIDLERGIRALLGEDPQKVKDKQEDPQKVEAKQENSLTQQLYDHGLIASLFKGLYKQPITTRWHRVTLRTLTNLPSYIPARSFALALMDLLLSANKRQLSGAAGATPATVPPTPIGASAAQPPVVVAGAVPAGASASSSPSAAVPALVTIQELRDAVSACQNVKLKEALLPLIDAAGNNIAVARQNIETWFDSSMDRVSGWYKRRVQKVLFWIGLAIALAVNADTIAIVQSLANDLPLRQSLVTAAQNNVAVGPSAIELPADGSPIESCRTDSSSPECRLEANLQQIQRLGLRIGWSAPGSWPTTAVGWLYKIAGLLLTAIAITLGAPLWFDLLNKFIVIRSTVKPREKSPEETSKD